MKIILTADPELPVPPKLYGGIERIIDMLVRGLVERGHEVTLISHRDSNVPCCHIPYPASNSQSKIDTVRNAVTVAATVMNKQFDLIHSFGRVAYLLPLLPLSIPKLMTYQREVTARSVRWGNRLSRGTLQFCAISDWMTERTKHLGTWHKVFNGVPMNIYDYVPSVPADAPLMFLGRIEHIKGTHLAIEIARRSGRKLIIAGNIPHGHEAYFETQVKPWLDDNQIIYIGPVDDQQKNHWLGRSAALLMPILWEEPFGIVMAEALACGTPVLGMRRGAVPEVVEHGVTGYVVEDIDSLSEAVWKLLKINRLACRKRAEELFSDKSVVEGYLSVYQKLLGI